MNLIEALWEHFPLWEIKSMSKGADEWHSGRHRCTTVRSAELGGGSAPNNNKKIQSSYQSARKAHRKAEEVPRHHAADAANRICCSDLRRGKETGADCLPVINWRWVWRHGQNTSVVVQLSPPGGQASAQLPVSFCFTYTVGDSPTISFQNIISLFSVLLLSKCPIRYVIVRGGPLLCQLRRLLLKPGVTSFSKQGACCRLLMRFLSRFLSRLLCKKKLITWSTDITMYS